MAINYSNTNSIWASVLVETLYRLGLTTAILCPGSRSTPLTVAFAEHPHIEAIPVLDERSAAFFALGRARQTRLPVVLVCTSGTAGANFYPAVIEARESRVPLLVLTSDRPPEMRDCNAGQTIDQQKLFGAYPNWYSELAVPSLEEPMLAYLRQTLIHAWERAQYPTAGAVHLNLPFRDPLAPIPQSTAQIFSLPENFFESVFSSAAAGQSPDFSSLGEHWPMDWLRAGRGLLIAETYCRAIAQLSKALSIPVLAEGLSPVRNYADLNPYLVSTYGLILREADSAQSLQPDWVIRVGEMPTSKELRQWLAQIQPRQWVIDAGDRNLDPLHGRTTHLRMAVEDFATERWDLTEPLKPPDAYLKAWCDREQHMRQAIDRFLSQTQALFEGKVAWLLSQSLPPQTPLFIANSMPVRDIELFWQPGNLAIRPFFNRGANGIDGTLSTALGVAHRQQSSVLLIGDLALLHDTNGFLIGKNFQGHLTIVLINNKGGGIFESLPIAQFEPLFEEFFATPQAIEFAQLCAAYGVAYEHIQDWHQLAERLTSLPEQGIRVLEIRTNRKTDTQWRQQLIQWLEA
jgi:2-succinyl-5-enolpyruvyl-6-hydroxy-3-cyclohexene-1-carboxylate synthase